MKGLWYDLVNLFFPRLCQACGEALSPADEEVCTHCLFQFPYTNFHLTPENPMEQAFWGRVPVEAASAFLYFHKGSKVQNMIHRFKYKGRHQIGTFLGRVYGYKLANQPPYNTVDMIIPVPLFKKKQLKRGYNQSEVFAKGLAIALNIPVETNILFRVKESATQTRKTREERWENVKEIFTVAHPEQLDGKHILLVDDVMTTGATLEACAAALMKENNIKLSVVTIAYAGGV
jgi:ComF family protein